MLGCEAAEEIEAGALVGVVGRWEDVPEGVTEKVAGGKLSEVAEATFVESVVVPGYHQLSKNGLRVADSTVLVSEVSAKEGVGSELRFEAEMEKGTNGGPFWSLRGKGVEQGVITRDSHRNVLEVKLGVDDSKVVISVVIIRPRFTCEAHAGEGAELGFHVRLEVNVEVDEMGGNVEALHFEGLEDDRLAMLGLVEGGVVVGILD